MIASCRAEHADKTLRDVLLIPMLNSSVLGRSKSCLSYPSVLNPRIPYPASCGLTAGCISHALLPAVAVSYGFPHPKQVISVLISLMHEDPSRRPLLRIFRELLGVAQVWSSNRPGRTDPLPSDAAQILTDATRSLGDGRPRAAWIGDCIERQGVVWWRNRRLLDYGS